MKIRQGFVSNSSTSSFALIGKEVPFETLTKEDLIKHKHIAIIENFGEGTAAWELDPKKFEMVEAVQDSLKLLKNVNRCFRTHLVTQDMDNRVLYPLDKIDTKGMCLYAFYGDSNAPYNMEDINDWENER
jgi:hypothetical protein